jgi:hypothetical protein
MKVFKLAPASLPASPGAMLQIIMFLLTLRWILRGFNKILLEKKHLLLYMMQLVLYVLLQLWGLRCFFRLFDMWYMVS